MPSAHNPVGRNPPPIGAAVIDLHTAARLAMCSPRQIQLLVKSGHIPRPERGRYTVLGVVRGRIDSLLEQKENQSSSMSAGRLQDARAREVEARTASRQAALMRNAEAETITVIDEFFGALRADIGALPARITPNIALRRRMEDLLDEAFGRAAKRALATADRIEVAIEQKGHPGRPASLPSKTGRNGSAK